MLNYRVREVLTHLTFLENDVAACRAELQRLLPKQALLTEERVIWKAIVEIEAALEIAQDAAKKLAVDHAQASLFWYEADGI